MLSQTKHKSTIIYGRKGAALLLTLIVMITLTSVVGAYLGFVQSSTRSTGAQIADSQAIYLADAGLHYGIYNLKQDSGWAGTASPISLGEGTFSVSVTDLGGGDYRLTSTGTVDDLSRQIQQTNSVVAGGTSWDYEDYKAYYAGGDGTGSYSTGKSVTITGDLFINGDFTLGQNSTVNGDVTATGTITLESGASITGTQSPGADPPVGDPPSLNTTYYNDLIDTAADEASGDLEISGEISGTTYVNGTVTVTGNLSGSGTIVATGKITVNQNKTVGDNIDIITDQEIEIIQGATIGDNCTVFSNKLVKVEKNCDIGSSSTGSLVLCPLDIEVLQGSTIYGLVFGLNEIKFEKNVNITGNIAGGEINAIEQGVTFTLDNDLIDFGTVQGLGGTTETDTQVTPQNDWNEI